MATDYLRSFLVNCGGVNNSVSDELIADNQLAVGSNVIPDPDGGNLKKRPGYPSYLAGVANKTVNGMYAGYNNRYFTASDSVGGSGKDFVIYDLDTGAELYSDTTAYTAPFHWASSDTTDYLTVGTAALKTTDGTTFSAWTDVRASGVSAVGLNLLAMYNNMMFAIGYLGLPADLYWAAPGDPESWSAMQNARFNTKQRNSAYNMPSAMIVHDKMLVLFFQQGYHLIHATGVTDVSIPYSRHGVGCIGVDAALSTPFGLIWWSATHGIVISRDGSNVEYPMQDNLSATFAAVKPYQTSAIHAVWRDDLKCARFFVPLNVIAQCNTRIDYYPTTNAFYVQDLSGGFATGVGKSLVVVDNIASPVISEYVSAGIGMYKEDATLTADNGVNATATIKTKRIAAPSALVTKRTAKVMLTTQSGSGPVPPGNLTYGYYVDNGTTLSRSVSVPIAATVTDTTVGIEVSHRKIQHQITDASATQTKYIALHESGALTKEP